MEENRKSGVARVVTLLMETFGLSHGTAVAAAFLIFAVVLFGIFWVVHASPPRTLVITAGAPGSSFETNAMKYRLILARSRVNLKILSSEGSLENLKRLQDPSTHVDVGFVQGGMSNEASHRKLFSLGSVSYQPLLVFHRGTNQLTTLAELTGKRIVVGPEGSGTHALALTLLGVNGIHPGGPTTLLNLESAEGAKALMDGGADAIFLMGDSASPQVMRELLLRPGIHLLNFSQADAYARRIPYLNRLVLPMGSIDFAKNIPSQDVFLIAPTVELLARPGLHPALSDLLLEAVQEVHGGSGLLKRKGEFPSAIEQEFPISAEATRYYKSGKTFLYRRLPFWLASLVNPILVAIVPVIVLLIPALKAIPALFRLRVRLRIYRWYRALLTLEREVMGVSGPASHQDLMARLDHIEQGVNRMKVPASFADQFYALRGYIAFVRDRLVSGQERR